MCHAAAIWLAFNHGLRVSELCDLRWGDLRWDERTLMVRRLKGSASGEHPLTEHKARGVAEALRRQDMFDEISVEPRATADGEDSL